MEGEENFGVYLKEHKDVKPEEVIEIEIKGRVIWLISLGNGKFIPWYSPDK